MLEVVKTGQFWWKWIQPAMDKPDWHNDGEVDGDGFLSFTMMYKTEIYDLYCCCGWSIGE